MRPFPIPLLFGIVLALAPVGGAAWGHPGHGTTDPDSAAHTAEPVHAAPFVATVIAAAAASAAGWKSGRKRR